MIPDEEPEQQVLSQTLLDPRLQFEQHVDNKERKENERLEAL